MSVFFHFSAGVFKVDHTVAGYKELHDVAVQRSLDPWFYLLLIRKVSQYNHGIEFVYMSEDQTRTIDHYRHDLEQLFGRGQWGVYAVDYSNHRGGSDSIDPWFVAQKQTIKHSIIVSKALTIDI